MSENITYYDPIYILDIYKEGALYRSLVDCRYERSSGAYRDDNTEELYPVPIYEIRLRGYNYEKMNREEG